MKEVEEGGFRAKMLEATSTPILGIVVTTEKARKRRVVMRRRLDMVRKERKRARHHRKRRGAVNRKARGMKERERVDPTQGNVFSLCNIPTLLSSEVGSNLGVEASHRLEIKILEE